MGEYQTYSAEKWWLPYGKYDTTRLVRRMASRRSCCIFNDRTVDRETLIDLVTIGITAPSGTNSQRWTFTIMPTRKAFKAFTNHISFYFKKLNAMAEKTILRAALKLMGKKELDEFFRGCYRKVKKVLEEWDESGRDRLFHGAPSAIIVNSKPRGSGPMEDALLATQNILLSAYSTGLGSCLIGYAVAR